jgi:hypothetical protein
MLPVASTRMTSIGGVNNVMRRCGHLLSGNGGFGSAGVMVDDGADATNRLVFI